MSTVVDCRDFQIEEKIIADPSFLCTPHKIRIHILKIQQEDSSPNIDYYLSKLDFEEYCRVNPGKSDIHTINSSCFFSVGKKIIENAIEIYQKST